MTARSVTLPGVAAGIPLAREFTRTALAGSPDSIVYDAELIVSELAANAVTHTTSGLPGGMFTVTIDVSPDRVLLEVADGGAPRGIPAVPAQWPPADGEHGRGLWLVTHLSGSFAAVPGRARCTLDLTATARKAAAA